MGTPGLLRSRLSYRRDQGLSGRCAGLSKDLRHVQTPECQTAAVSRDCLLGPVKCASSVEPCAELSRSFGRSVRSAYLLMGEMHLHRDRP